MSEPTIILRDGRPAIDVKDHGAYWHDPKLADDLETIGEAEVERIYDGLRENFWEHYAPEIARGHGYGSVYADGRSGGWLVVEGVPDFWEKIDSRDPISVAEATFQLEDLRARRLTPPTVDPMGAGFTIAQEIAEAEEVLRAVRERDNFLRFAREVVAEINHLREEFEREVREAAKRVRREPDLRADAAARDIVTVDP